MNFPDSRKTPAYWVVIPAAGIGSRMEASCPKQYLPLLDKTILEHTLERLLAIPVFQGIHIALANYDNFWPQLAIAKNRRITCVNGGGERADSVLNCLHALTGRAQDDDWVLVHDAARPCIRRQEVLKLIEVVNNHPVGGILGVPVSDTLKQVSGVLIDRTLDRSHLWQAQTPQMFRLGLLRECLQRAGIEGKTVTDEASAVETYGYQPLMVLGRSDNIKITRPEDLGIAAMLMQQQKI